MAKKKTFQNLRTGKKVKATNVVDAAAKLGCEKWQVAKCSNLIGSPDK